MRHIADASADIEDALAVQPKQTDRGAGRRRRAFAAGLIVLAVSAVSAAAAAWLLPRSQPVQVTRSIIPADTFPGPTFGKNLAVTSDGSHLLYVSGDQTEIHLHAVDSLEAVPLVTSIRGADLRGLAVSPDEQQVAYVELSYTLKKVAITGGTPVTLAQLDGPVRGVTWRGDGVANASGRLSGGTDLADERCASRIPKRRRYLGARSRSPSRLFDGPYVFRTPNLARQYDVGPDGQRFLLIKEERPATPSRIVLVQHWEEELNQRAGAAR